MEKDKETDMQTAEEIGKKSPKDDQKDETEGELRVYEVSYLLLSFITEEDVPREVGRLKEQVGGTVFSEESPKLMKLAYSMFKVIANKKTKFDNAYFGWVKFEGEAGDISKVKKALENNENILRFLILKTTKESVAPRKPFPFAVKPKVISTPVVKEEIKSEAPQEINEVELDKTIDDLVIE
jgi:ribosomal protein S6